MKDLRITSHPILPRLEGPFLDFTFDGRPLKARKGEVISSALHAAGITVFGHHPKDRGGQGIFGVSGQGSQCTVIADGKPVKSCMTPVREGMQVKRCEGLPVLDTSGPEPTSHEVDDIEVQVLVVGGGSVVVGLRHVP